MTRRVILASNLAGSHWQPRPTQLSQHGAIPSSKMRYFPPKSNSSSKLLLQYYTMSSTVVKCHVKGISNRSSLAASVVDPFHPQRLAYFLTTPNPSFSIMNVIQFRLHIADRAHQLSLDRARPCKQDHPQSTRPGRRRFGLPLTIHLYIHRPTLPSLLQSMLLLEMLDLEPDIACSSI